MTIYLFLIYLTDINIGHKNMNLLRSLNLQPNMSKSIRKTMIILEMKMKTDNSVYRNRQRRKVLRFVNYQKHLDEENFCREQLLLFSPWRDESDIELDSIGRFRDDGRDNCRSS